MSTDVVSETTGFSKLDLQAIRQCDRVCFYHDGESDSDEGRIVLRKEIENPGPFDPKERDYDLTGLTSRVHDYREPCDGRPDAYSCFASISSSRYSDSVWHSIAAFVKVGDTFRLCWQADGNSHTKAHGLHLDELTLIVERHRGGKGTESYPFIVDTSCSPDNTARMIRGK